MSSPPAATPQPLARARTSGCRCRPARSTSPAHRVGRGGRGGRGRSRRATHPQAARVGVRLLDGLPNPRRLESTPGACPCPCPFPSPMTCLCQVRRVGSQQQDERLERGARPALPLVRAVHKLHHPRDCSVELHGLGVVGHLGAAGRVSGGFECARVRVCRERSPHATLFLGAPAPPQALRHAQHAPPTPPPGAWRAPSLSSGAAGAVAPCWVPPPTEASQSQGGTRAPGSGAPPPRPWWTTPARPEGGEAVRGGVQQQQRRTWRGRGLAGGGARHWAAPLRDAWGSARNPLHTPLCRAAAP